MSEREFVLEIGVESLKISHPRYTTRGQEEVENFDAFGRTHEIRASSPSRHVDAIRVVGAGDVDLAKPKGYALGKRWAKWGEAVVAKPGEAIVFKDRYNKTWEGVLVLGDGNTRVITDDDLERAIQIESDAKRVAMARNSRAYALALYAFYLAKSDSSQKGEGSEGEAEAVEHIRAAIETLSGSRPEVEAVLQEALKLLMM